MTTATIATAIPAADMATLGHSVYSSAMRSWALVVNNDNDPELLVLFREGGTVYRYSFSGWEAGRSWDALREQDDACGYDDGAEPVSWGRCFHAFLRDGLILPIAA
jgi:hypothetical protein